MAAFETEALPILKFDPEANAAYLRLKYTPGTTTTELNDNVNVDCDAETGKLVGIEVLGITQQPSTAKEGQMLVGQYVEICSKVGQALVGVMLSETLAERANRDLSPEERIWKVGVVIERAQSILKAVGAVPQFVGGPTTVQNPFTANH
jgi:uncharacterized protein YuzE